SGRKGQSATAYQRRRRSGGVARFPRVDRGGYQGVERHVQGGAAAFGTADDDQRKPGDRTLLEVIASADAVGSIAIYQYEDKETACKAQASSSRGSSTCRPSRPITRKW